MQPTTGVGPGSCDFTVLLVSPEEYRILVKQREAGLLPPNTVFATEMLEKPEPIPKRKKKKK